jgi:putative hemolysin
MSVWAELGIIVLLTAFNGVFTGAEIAMLSVRKTRLRELADDGSTSAKAALRLRKTPETLLATIQIGITVIGATTAVFGGSRLAAPLAGLLSRGGLGNASEWLAFALVIMLVSYLSLVIGELVPKSLALRAPERFALTVATPLSGLAAIGRPLVWLLTASSNALLRPLNDRTTFSESRLSPDELQQLLEEAAASGALHTGAGEIASRAIDLAWLRANALMVPRTKIVSLDVETPPQEVLRLLHDVPHARYPVHEGGVVEKVCGYVLARDAYDAIVGGTLSLRALVRPVPFFPETSPAIEVLRALQAAKQQLGLLVDEQGELAGLITIEDIAEELFGEILEEHETPRPLLWQEDGDATHVALGNAPIHEVSRQLGEDLTEDTTATTIAGLVAEKAGRVPAVGERTTLGSRVEAEVLEATPRQVGKLRLHVRAEDEPHE